MSLIGAVLCFFTTLANAATVPAGQDLRFQNVVDLVQQQHLKTIEDALPVLTQKYPEYFKFNTLMYNSMSLQESTFTNPRVIVFGPEAKFIMAFNGDSQKRGGGSFETVEYDGQNHQFLFREIAFKYPGYNINLDPSEIAYQDANIAISNPNPQKCTACHGKNATPIWATYFVWPGAYGSDDDDLTMSLDKQSWNPNNEDFFSASTRPQSMGRQMVFKPGFNDDELSGMLQYLHVKPQHPRYKWLPAAFAEPGLLRYEKGEVLANLDYSAEANAERQRVNASYDWPSRPNDFFQSILIPLNQDRILNKLSQAGINKGAFAGPAWLQLEKFESSVQGGATVLHDLAGEIAKELTEFSFKGPRPDAAAVEVLLKTNFTNEIQNVRQKIMIEQSGFTANSLQWYPYAGDTAPHTRDGLDYLGDPVPFYTNLLGLGQFTDVDTIAVHLETDDMAAITMLNILLMDKGVDLHDFSTNFLHQSLSFHDGGLHQVMDYLGVQGRF